MQATYITTTKVIKIMSRISHYPIFWFLFLKQQKKRVKSKRLTKGYEKKKLLCHTMKYVTAEKNMCYENRNLTQRLVISCRPTTLIYHHSSSLVTAKIQQISRQCRWEENANPDWLLYKNVNKYFD